MKINLIHKKLSKSLLLASAIFMISFSSAYAADYAPEEGFSGAYIYNTTDVSGTIYLPEWKDAFIYNSTLGNASGGRFTVNADAGGGGSFVVNQNSTVYVDSFNGKLYEIQVSGSTLIVDNAISNINLVSLYGVSVFKAPSIEDASVKLQQSVYAEFKAINVGQMELNNSVWRTVGSSKVGYLDMYDNSLIEFVMTGSSDTLTISAIYARGNPNIKISFTDEFIEESIANTGGTFGFYMDNTIVISSIYIEGQYDEYADNSLNIGVSNSNGSYKWDVIDYGNGNFDITNFVLIPEPSTYAMIFGVLALGLAIYRRRK